MGIGSDSTIIEETALRLPTTGPSSENLIDLSVSKSHLPELDIEDLLGSSDIVLLERCLTLKPIDVSNRPILADAIPLIRSSAFDRLFYLAHGENSSTKQKSAVEVLVRHITADDHPGRKVELCKLLSSHPEYNDMLIEMLSSQFEKVRNAAGFALGNIIKTESLSQFNHNSESNTETKVLDVCDDLLQDPARAEAICYSLFYSKSPRAKEVISKIANCPDPSFAHSIASKIAKSQHEESV